jgi:hypothetical protein
MALTAFLGASFVCALIWVERPTPAHAALFGAATGLAVLSKFSTLAFLPAAIAAALAWYYAAERPKLRELLHAARERVPTLALAAIVGALTIWAGYRFSFGKVDFAGLRLPAPELYAGVQEVMNHNAAGHSAYLLGERSHTGFWCFYPVVLAVKTPLGFLALLGIGLVWTLRKGNPFRRGWLPLAFAAGILLAASFSRINIGVRHILPVYIGFSLIAAAAAVRWLEAGATRKWAAVLLLAWAAISSLLSHPGYIAYFNELAGGEPEKILVDSDLDWGQDLTRLSQRLRELGAQEVFFDPIVIADLEGQHGFPRVYSVDLRRPMPGWNVVSPTLWKSQRYGLFDTHPELTLWPDRVKPTERVGSLLLYYAPPPVRGR